MKTAFTSTLLAALLALVSPDGLSAPELPLAPGRSSCDGAFLTSAATVPGRTSSVTAEWRGDLLSFTVRHELGAGNAPVAKGDGDDPTGIFRGDAIELFLAPHPERPEVYYQFAVNPSNVLYQAKGPDVTWRPAKSVRTRSEVADGFWQASFEISLGAFGENIPRTGDRWGANFVCGGANWAGIGDLHSPLTFGHLVFGAPPEKIALSALSLADGTLTAVFDKTADLDATVEIGNSRHAFKPGETRLSIVEDVETGGTNAAIAHKALTPVDISAVANGETLLSLHAFADTGDPEWLVLDQFYYPATNELNLAYSAKGFAKPSLSIRSLASGAIVFNAKMAEPNGNLKVPGLVPGAYAFEIGEGTRQASCEFCVTTQKTAKGKFKGIALRTEKPRALFALREKDGQTEAFYPVVGDGLNSALAIPPCLSHGFTRHPTAGFVFDDALADGLYGADAALAKMPADATVLNRIGYEAQMAVMAKSTNGEIRVLPSGSRFFKALYGKIKERHPERLFSIQIDSQLDPEVFASACDIFETAFWGSSYAASMMARLPDDLASLRIFAGEKPTLLWLGGSIPSGQIRTADELNAAIHLCIIRGVSGNVIHLGHGGVPKSRTRLWSFLLGIEDEIAKWYPAWIMGEEFALDATGDGIEFAARKLADGSLLVLAVNTKPIHSVFRYKAPGMETPAAMILPGYGTLLTRPVK